MIAKTNLTPTKYWWDAAEGAVHTAVNALLAHCDSTQAKRAEEIALFERMYGGKSVSHIAPFAQSDAKEALRLAVGRMKRNVAKAAIDALAAEIAQHKPRPLWLTKKGSDKLKKAAKKRTRYCEGQFFKHRVYETMQTAFFDGCRVGTGVVKVTNDGHDLVIERVHPGELYVVDVETIYGKTRQIHHVKYIAKTEVMALACVDTDEKREMVEKSTAVTEVGARMIGASEIIRVVESYRLPVLRGKKVLVPGKRTITVSGGDLLDKPWNRERLPFAFYRYQRPAFGFWGTGVCQQLTTHQYEINKLLAIAQEAMAYCSAPWVVTQNSTDKNKIALSHLRNEAGAIIDGGYGQISVVAPQPIHPIILQQIENLVAAAFEDVGVSRAAAQQQSQLGSNASGAAQREEHDRYSRRFMLQHQAFDQFSLDIAQLIVDEAAELAGKNGGKLPVDVPLGDGIETVDWADTEPGEEMVLQCYPTNFFSSTPPAKKQEVIEALQAGWLTREQAMKQLDMPDIASESALITAYQDHVDRIAGLILDDGMSLAKVKKARGFWPESYDVPQIDMMIDRMSRHLKKAQAADDTETPRLDLMREWANRAVGVKKKYGPKPQPAPAAPALPMAA